MNNKTKFGACRKYITVLVLLCMLLVSCGGRTNDTDVTGSVTVSDSVSVSSETGISTDPSEEQSDNAITGESDVPVTTEDGVTANTDSVREPITDDGSETDKAESGRETGEGNASEKPVKTEDTRRPEPELTTAPDDKGDDKPNVTGGAEDVTTTPLIQVLPDGGLLLPDDVWD